MGTTENWDNIRVPKELKEQIEYRVNNDPDFRKMGFISISKFVTFIIQRELEKYVLYEHKTIIPSREKQSSDIELIGTIDGKIVLKDSVCGIIFIEIDDNKRLQCYQSAGDTHNNKWVNYCLKNKELFDFLKKHEIKVVAVRTKD